MLNDEEILVGLTSKSQLKRNKALRILYNDQIAIAKIAESNKQV